MIVYSSIWLEIFRKGSLQEECLSYVTSGKPKVPSLVLFEVYRKVKEKISDEIALEAMAFLSKYEVLDLDRDTAILAGDLSIEHSMAMADSVMLAHSRIHNLPLLTLDNDFHKIENVVVVRRKK